MIKQITIIAWIPQSGFRNLTYESIAKTKVIELNELELSNLLNKKIKALQKELNQLKRARRTGRAKARSRYSIGQIPSQG